MYQSGNSEKPRKLVSDVADFDAPLMFEQPEVMLKLKIVNNKNMWRNTGVTRPFQIKRSRIPDSN